jgi:hypothetical protein
LFPDEVFTRQLEVEVKRGMRGEERRGERGEGRGSGLECEIWGIGVGYKLSRAERGR